MEKKYWKDKMANEEIFEIVKGKTTLIDVIRSRKKKWIEHVLRGNGRLKETIDKEEYKESVLEEKGK